MIALAALGTLFVQSCDKDDDIDNPKLPAVVQDDFAQRYPGVEYAEWEKEKPSKKYVAEFYFYGTHAEWDVQLNGVEAKAWYSSSGAWEKTEFDVMHLYRNQQDTFIPANVRETIRTQSGGREIDLDVVDTSGTDYFLLEIDREPRDTYVKIDFSGNVIP